MNIHRTDFLEALARSTPSLGLICMNHTGSPTKLLTDISTITFIADKESKAAFIEYCKSHPLIKSISIFPNYRWSTVLLVFLDGSELNFTLMKHLVRKTFVCLDFQTIKKASFVNSYGMLVSSLEHQYDFLVTNCQFSKYSLADRYKNYFATFDSGIRAGIFRYMQSRYHLVFNTLDDLYVPKPNTLLSMVVGLRAEKRNTLLRMFIRVIEQVSFTAFSFITRKPIRISPVPHYSPELPSSKKQAAGHSN